jgi:hypothetical protein
MWTLNLAKFCALLPVYALGFFFFFLFLSKQREFCMLFLERFAGSVFQLIFGGMPAKAVSGMPFCTRICKCECLPVKAASVTWEFSACQLVRFPDKHFRM